jgi:uncharacterized protein
MNPPTTASEKLAALRELLRGYGSALVCFSGGVDSAFLLAVAKEALGERATALLAESPSLARREAEAAQKLAEKMGVALVVVESNELERGQYKQNPVNRCYFCKSELLELATTRAAAMGFAAVCLGTNLDDLGDHRPGLVAAEERGARHPMVEVGLSKAEIRALSRELGLPTWNKPQLACLSSRFPYGTEITLEGSRASTASRRASLAWASRSCACAFTSPSRASSSSPPRWREPSSRACASRSSRWGARAALRMSPWTSRATARAPSTRAWSPCART